MHADDRETQPRDDALLELADEPSARPSESVVHLLVSDLRDSPLRKRRDDGDLDELAASMKVRGVLQPLVVRARRGRFEVVVGHRRFHAAPRAGLTALPCIVRELSDDEVLAAFIVSKCQRKNIHPLDEGDAFHELRTTHGWSVARIAKEVGKAPATIYSRLKLRELAPLPWEALLDGRLSTQLAVLIARIASPDLQTKATREVLRLDVQGAEPMPFAAALEHIRRGYMLTALGAEVKPGDLFDCHALRCRLTAAACVERQNARAGSSRYEYPKHRMCGPETAGDASPCAQGREVRAALGLPPGTGSRKDDTRAPRAAVERGAIEVPPLETPQPKASEERAAESATSEDETPGDVLPLRAGGKQPSRQTREWLAFTEKHAIDQVLEDPTFYGFNVAKELDAMPFDSMGQRAAACLAAGVSLAFSEGVSRAQVRRLIDEFYATFERNAAQESA
jgi:ParB/RepB/Spo0J family partition protein